MQPKFCDVVKRLKEATKKTSNLFNKWNPNLISQNANNFPPQNLADQYLPDNWLSTLPFGDYLCKSMEKDTRQIKIQNVEFPFKQRVHVLYALTVMDEVIIKENLSYLLRDNKGTYEMVVKALKEFWRNEWADVVSTGFDLGFTKDFLLVATLYHDIGKAIDPSRHSTEGQHLIHELGAISINKHRGQLVDLMNNGRPGFGETYCWLLERFVRSHDVWGNITTGEASLAFFSTALEFILTTVTVKSYLSHLGLLLLLNIADQCATCGLLKDGKPIGLEPEKIELLLKHWQIMRKILEDTNNVPEKAKTALMIYAQRDREVVLRIMQLLDACGLNCAEQRVAAILRDFCGGRFPRFCELFGTVKLSYALKFFKGLTKIALEDQFPHEKIAVVIISILKRIIDTYESQIDTNRRGQMCTGIEMWQLTRDKSVTESIIKTLLHGGPEVFIWIDDEVSAYPLVM